MPILGRLVPTCFQSYDMQRWTKKLEKVEKINLSLYGMTSLVTLRGLPVDHAFLDACLHLWDPQTHVFRFGTHYKEMYLTYEEFAALLGNDSKRASVAAPTGIRFFRSFMRMLGLSMAAARESVVGDQVNLFGLIKVADMVLQMERRVEVWLRDHLRVVEPPRRRPYGPLQYQSKRVVEVPSPINWFQIAYLLGLDSITFYPSSRLLRKMEHVQGLPPARALFLDILIFPRVTVAVLGSWSRGAHLVEAGVLGGRSATYEAWWIAEHGDRKRERRANLT
ncbi:hypothetical protein JCGZ_18101 [Jatropha curcas]|uniref:Aminotransferase-like plant mobile domain-containing protein n=1 Tax=Jatropha curcas TaxID=180498 RepID=A0A067KD27_JATCU|nr:hypothetical protein JCGZ_18101 [Jatropha curcas]